MKKFDVMVAGHLCLDIIPSIPDTGKLELTELLSPGKLVHVGAPQVSTGGAVSNTGIVMKKLGNRVCFTACVGNDDFGRLTVNLIKQHGNGMGIRISQESNSSYSVVIAPPHIDRIFLHSPGSNDFFTSEDLNLEQIAMCRHFHFGYPQLMAKMFADEGAEMVKVMRLAKETGATTSLDMALPDPSSPAGQALWDKILLHVLPYTDIFLPSIEEALFSLEKETFLSMKQMHGNAELIDFLDIKIYQRLSKRILKMGAKMTALKAGRLGWYFRTGKKIGDKDNWANRELWSPSFQVTNPKSTTGAGDSSIAGFLTAFLKGMSIEESLRCASCLGWQNIQELDAVSGARDWKETLRMLKSRELSVVKIPETFIEFSWNEKQGIYNGPNDRI